VTFMVSGPARIISGDDNPTPAVAGIATVYVQTQYNSPGTIIVTASANGCSGSDTVRSVAASNEIYTALHAPAAFSTQRVQDVRLVQRGALISISIPADGAGAAVKPRFSLYNMQGRLVRSRTVEAGARTLLPIDDCGRGMYLGRLTAGTREYVLRVVSIRP
jgi:hypothetical protein